MPSHGKIDNDSEKGDKEMGQRISANRIKSLWGWENLSQSVQPAGPQQVGSQPWDSVCVSEFSLEGAAHTPSPLVLC